MTNQTILDDNIFDNEYPEDILEYCFDSEFEPFDESLNYFKKRKRFIIDTIITSAMHSIASGSFALFQVNQGLANITGFDPDMINSAILFFYDVEVAYMTDKHRYTIEKIIKDIPIVLSNTRLIFDFVMLVNSKIAKNKNPESIPDMYVQEHLTKLSEAIKELEEYNERIQGK